MIERFIKNDVNLKRWRRFKQNKLAVFSALLLIFACFMSFTAEIWANNKPIILKYNKKIFYPVFKDYSPKDLGMLDSNQITIDYKKLYLNYGDWAIFPFIMWDPYESNEEVESYPSAPSLQNLMGTDDRGRDVLTRILYGLRYSMSYAVLVWFLTFIIGTCLGGMMGYFGGRIDFYGQRLTEILSTVPYLLLLIILVSIFNPSMTLLVVITTVFGWISISYYVRGEFLKNRRMEFVEAARAVGSGHRRIFFKHILPNSLTPIITFTPFTIAGYISGLAGLDYLGFGLAPPTPSWGELLNQAQQNFTVGWWLALYPSLALFFTLTLLSLVGEGVRDAFNPRE
jgi:microcin C transport system permease protein